MERRRRRAGGGRGRRSGESELLTNTVLAGGAFGIQSKNCYRIIPRFCSNGKQSPSWYPYKMSLSIEYLHHTGSVHGNLRITSNTITTLYKPSLAGCVAGLQLVCRSYRSCWQGSECLDGPLCSIPSWLICTPPPASRCWDSLGSLTLRKTHRRWQGGIITRICHYMYHTPLYLFCFAVRSRTLVKCVFSALGSFLS